jgi:hydrogenase expression/formation protein HypC
VGRTISLWLTPEAQVGDYVYVHTGYAISVVDEEEALESLRLLRELADTYPEEELFYSTG